MNYLLNEQPDKAVDIFIKLLEVDSDTVETHLALGSLFRRRGEVDRAIRIHQNLIARPQLSAEQRAESLLALGRDYMRAGVYDRAERIFQEFNNLPVAYTVTSLRYLLEIYERQKSWHDAIKCAQQLQSCTQEFMGESIANYYCELAEHALQQQQFNEAAQMIKQALRVSKHAVRPCLMQAKLAELNGQPSVAVKYYQQVASLDPDFISETIEPLQRCYQQLHQGAEFIQYMQNLQRQHPRISTVLVLAHWLYETTGPEAAIDYVTRAMHEHPSLKGLKQLIDWHLLHVEGKVADKLRVLQDITLSLLADKPVYRCRHCGFSTKHLDWHCPGCSRWGSVKPIHGLEGD